MTTMKVARRNSDSFQTLSAYLHSQQPPAVFLVYQCGLLLQRLQRVNRWKQAAMLSLWTTFTTVKSHLTWFRDNAVHQSRQVRMLFPEADWDQTFENRLAGLSTLAAFNFSFWETFKYFTLDLPVTTLHFWLDQIKHVSILEPIEVFFVVRRACKVARWSNFVENIINKKSYEPARAFRDLWSLVMFWKFSNCTRLRLV